MTVHASVYRPKWVPVLTGLRTVLANSGLIALGSLVFVYGMNAVMVPAGFFSGGVTGIALLIAYHEPAVDVGLAYLLLNIPLILIGWRTIGTRFIFYTLFGIGVFSSTASQFRPPPLPIADPILAALVAGVICGAGAGLILRSLGSAGGLDILAIVMNRRFGFRVGTVLFSCNAAIVLSGAYVYDLSMTLYTVVFMFVSGKVTNTIISGFNTRKAVLIISDKAEEIARSILYRIDRGVTFLDGEGAYSQQRKKVILTVTALTELPKLKETVLDIDPKAFVVINDTLEVIVKRHRQWRVT